MWTITGGSGAKSISSTKSLFIRGKSNALTQFPRTTKNIPFLRYDDALYDVAILKLDRDVKFGKDVQPICLPFGEHFPDIRFIFIQLFFDRTV